MLNKILMYVVLFLIGTTVFYYGISEYRGGKLETAKEDIEKLETKSEIKEAVHTVENFEGNQSIKFKMDKEVKIEDIPSNIGVHTINPNEWM